jgi:hypothetical protein
MLGLVWRQILFWSWASFWFGGSLALLASLAVQAEGADPWRVLCLCAKFALFTSTFFLILREWSRLNRRLLVLGQSLVRAGINRPARIEWVTHSLWIVVPTAVVIAAAVLVRQALAGTLALFVPATFAWTVVVLCIATLILGGVTLARYALAARRATVDPNLVRGSVQPWTTALFASAVLIPVYIGLPDPELLTRAVVSAGSVGWSVAAAFGRFVLTLIIAIAEAANQREIAVELGPDDFIEEVQPTLAAHGATATSMFPTVTPWEDVGLARTYVVTVQADRADALRKALEYDGENVARVELAVALGAAPTLGEAPCSGRAALPVDDPLAPVQTGLDQIGGANAISLMQTSRTGSPVRVGIVDTGILSRHPDLAGVTPAFEHDWHGHGTAVASIVGAIADNGTGLASLNVLGRWFDLRGYGDLSASPTSLELAQGIVAAADDGARVIVVAATGSGPVPRSVSDAVAFANDRDSLIVAAAGNDRSLYAAWPASLGGVVSVGALDEDGDPAYFASSPVGTYGLWAPGTDVCVASTSGGYTMQSGSSFAAPLVGGVAAATRAVCPRLSAQETARILATTANPGGVVQADRAISAALLRCALPF